MNDLPKRKPTRLKGFDYSSPGMYFLTVCVKSRANLLGKIVGCGDFDAPQMILSDYGIILDKYIVLMNNKYSHIKIDKYVIMPNHFHLILHIKEHRNGASETAAPYNNEMSKFISLLKRYCNREYEKIWEYIDTNILRWEKDCFYTDEKE